MKTKKPSAQQRAIAPGLDLVKSSGAIAPIAKAPQACSPASLDPSAVTVPGAPGNADLAPTPPPDDWRRLLSVGLDLSRGPQPVRSPLGEAYGSAGGRELKERLLGTPAARHEALLAIVAAQVADYAVLSQVLLLRMSLQGPSDYAKTVGTWLPLKTKVDHQLLAAAEALHRLESPLRIALTADHVNVAGLQQVIEGKEPSGRAPTSGENP